MRKIFFVLCARDFEFGQLKIINKTSTFHISILRRFTKCFTFYKVQADIQNLVISIFTKDRCRLYGLLLHEDSLILSRILFFFKVCGFFYVVSYFLIPSYKSIGSAAVTNVCINFRFIGLCFVRCRSFTGVLAKMLKRLDITRGRQQKTMFSL